MPSYLSKKIAIGPNYSVKLCSTNKEFQGNSREFQGLPYAVAQEESIMLMIQLTAFYLS